MKVFILVSIALVVGAAGGVALANGKQDRSYCPISPAQQHERTLAPETSTTAYEWVDRVQNRIRTKAGFWSAVVDSVV
jgi:hypothetical protein